MRGFGLAFFAALVVCAPPFAGASEVTCHLEGIKADGTFEADSDKIRQLMLAHLRSHKVPESRLSYVVGGKKQDKDPWFVIPELKTVTLAGDSKTYSSPDLTKADLDLCSRSVWEYLSRAKALAEASGGASKAQELIKPFNYAGDEGKLDETRKAQTAVLKQLAEEFTELYERAELVTRMGEQLHSSRYDIIKKPANGPDVIRAALPKALQQEGTPLPRTIQSTYGRVQDAALGGSAYANFTGALYYFAQSRLIVREVGAINIEILKKDEFEDVGKGGVRFSDARGGFNIRQVMELYPYQGSCAANRGSANSIALCNIDPSLGGSIINEVRLARGYVNEINELVRTIKDPRPECHVPASERGDDPLLLDPPCTLNGTIADFLAVLATNSKAAVPAVNADKIGKKLGTLLGP